MQSLSLLLRTGYMASMGWFHSLEKGRAVNRQLEPIPWITYSAIAFLENRVSPTHRVFEFGAGMSTLWWAGRCHSVHSVEHDHAWVAQLQSLLPTNAKVKHQDLEYAGQYCRSATAQATPFDIILVDGRDRVNCAIFSINALSDKGVIVWDDTNRQRYQPGLRYLEAKGFKRIDFEGLKPCVVEGSVTSVFYRDNNCFNL